MHKIFFIGKGTRLVCSCWRPKLQPYLLPVCQLNNCSRDASTCSRLPARSPPRSQERDWRRTPGSRGPARVKKRGRPRRRAPPDPSARAGRPVGRVHQQRMRAHMRPHATPLTNRPEPTRSHSPPGRRPATRGVAIAPAIPGARRRLAVPGAPHPAAARRVLVPARVVTTFY